MNAPQIKGPKVKGWCPGALTPMHSGDGLVVRVRPFMGRLSATQAKGIADLATRHGNGLLDVSSRANIQIRGVTDVSYPPLMEGLDALNLLDQSPEIEARRNVIVSPFWTQGDQTEALATALSNALTAADGPQTPSKFGFAVDTGAKPALQNAPADIRLERAASGDLLLVAEGAAQGKPVTEPTAIPEALALAHWFLDTRDDQSRMVKLLTGGMTPPKDHATPRQIQSFAPKPSQTAQGQLVGLAFGQLQADTLTALAACGALRLTPWRMVLVETSNELIDIEGLITDPADPLLNATACIGAPRCAQGRIETRTFARSLLPLIPQGRTLHISGCTKGCAHPKPADLTISGTPEGMSLIRNGRASDTPTLSGLSADQLIKAI